MYFFELSEHYTTRAWYFILRGLVSITFGVAILLRPDLAVDVVVLLFALWMIISSVLQIVPVVVKRTRQHLARQALFSGLTGLLVGGLALWRNQIAVDAAAFIFGLLLIFRAGLELTIFVEAPLRARHQRVVLIGALASLVIGIILLTSPFNDVHAFERLLGVYAIVGGSIHLIRAWHISETIETSEETAQAMSSEHRPIPVVPVIEDSAPPVKEPEPSNWVPATPGGKLDVTKYRRPLVLAPHPDDLEAFAGGLVYNLESSAVSVVFAGGDRGVWEKQYAQMDKTNYIRVRLSEAANAAKLLGVQEIIYMGFRDREVECSEDAVNKVLEIFRHHQPDLIVSFEFLRRANPYPHPDHMAAADIVRDAVAHYEFNQQLDYLVTSTLIPNVFVDVTGVRRVKLEALACHTTQTGLNGLIFPFLEKLITRIWGAFNGVDYAEGYRLVDVAEMIKRM